MTQALLRWNVPREEIVVVPYIERVRISPV